MSETKTVTAVTGEEVKVEDIITVSPAVDPDILLILVLDEEKQDVAELRVNRTDLIDSGYKKIV